MSRFPLGRYRVRFAAVDPVVLPSFSGSAWRGAFGHALRELSCVRACRSPSACPLAEACAYRYLFETPRPPDATVMRLYERVPHPFVLDAMETGGVHPPGSQVDLHLVLVGRAIGRLPTVLAALAHAAENGIGQGRGRLKLIRSAAETAVGSISWQAIDGRAAPAVDPTAVAAPPPPEVVLVDLLTPLRLKEQERKVTPSAFRPHHMLRNLLRRVSMLSRFHSDVPFEADFRALTDRARLVELREARLTWQDWQRYSSRQQTLLSMGGITGSFVLDADQLGPLWPILWLGQWVHAGKGTSMGLGKYRLADAASLPAGDGGRPAG